MVNDFENTNNRFVINSAKRLLDLFDPNIVNPLSGNQTYDAWSRIFNIPPQRQDLLFFAIGQVAILPSITSKQIETLCGESARKYLGWVHPVQGALGLKNLEAAFKGVTNAFNSERRLVIDICADQISSRCNETYPTKDELKSMELIYEQVFELVNEINSTDLNPKLKAFCLQHLNIVEQSIVKMRIFGAHAATLTFETSIGLASLRNETLRDLQDTEIGSKMTVILGRYAQWISILRGTEYILEKAKDAYQFAETIVDSIT